MTVARPLYNLLPVIHRIRDVEQGSPLQGPPLQGLLAVVEEELQRLVDDVDQLYDNWFIETCEDWVVPYLGDLLLGVEGLAGSAASQRALVADTLRLRRRKGTPAGLEQLARDVTGWPARVVEYFKLLGTTQHVDHVRPGRGGTVDLRDVESLELLDGPFSPAARTAEVRHIDVRRGRYNIPSVGVHLWRLASYPVESGDARPVDAAQGRWTFDPGGRDLPLFNRPGTGDDPSAATAETDVPGPLRRQLLDRLLRGGAEPSDPAEEPRCPPFPPPAPEPPPAAVVRVRWDGSAPSVPLVCCDLSAWTRPRGGPDGPVSVDPVLGRLTLPPGVQPSRIHVDYSYGFPGDLGAGPWDRQALTTAVLGPDATRVDWQVGVSADADPVPGTVVRTLAEAVRLWRTRRATEGQTGVIAVMDSATYRENVSVQLAPGERLLLVAATWPVSADPTGAGPQREAGQIVAAGLRPHLVGSLTVTGIGGSTAPGGELVVGGLSVEGGVRVQPGWLSRLALAGCTLRSDRYGRLSGSAMVTAIDNPHLSVHLERAVCASVRLRGVAALTVVDSILHAESSTVVLSVDAPGSRVEVDSSTLLGRTSARTLTASNALMRGLVDAHRRQEGCVRYSFLPLESRAPRRYRCQPGRDSPTPVAPWFASTDPFDPRFGKLHEQCPVEISAGADDEGEMGAYHFLQERRRVANLTAQLDHYLRFGLEAGVFFTT
jgi:hypothetical protein